MKRAIEETERRRAKQIAYNERHGITPRTVRKAVADIMEGAAATVPGRGRRKTARVAEERADYAALSPEQAMQRIRKLEQQMYEHARNLEFEEAARIRDEIARIRETALGLPAADVG